MAYLLDANVFIQAKRLHYALDFCPAFVTHDVPGDGVKAVKIPEVCVGLGVAFIGPFQMLRRERARFILAPASEGGV